jgi:hypothetical protein
LKTSGSGQERITGKEPVLQIIKTLNKIYEPFSETETTDTSFVTWTQQPVQDYDNCDKEKNEMSPMSAQLSAKRQFPNCSREKEPKERMIASYGSHTYNPSTWEAEAGGLLTSETLSQKAPSPPRQKISLS